MTDQAGNMRFVIAGLLLGILMAAMDNTIVTTAMGTIVSRLGGMEEFVWVTSAYMVAVVAGTPIFGKLSDMYGRKRFFMFGLIVFMLGSALCGTAGSIQQLSIYRAIQGIGGGALMPIAFTIIFDLFPPEKRGKMTGLFGAVFGLSSVLGPLLGGYITDHLGWYWVFYINVPIGIVSLIFIAMFYKESMQHSRQRIDWLGAFTLVGAIVSLMFAFELGGQKYAWDSSVIIGLFAAFALLFAIFLYVETKVAEPIISFAMFRERLFATSVVASLFYGSTFIVATVYIPIFVQGVFGDSASNSGLVLMPMMLGVVAGSQVGGVMSTRTSYRNTMLLSAACFMVGMLLLGTLSPETSRLMVTLYMILSGFGVGFSFSVLNMSAIHPFDMRRRGAATSTTTFIRSLGMTLGISIFGIVQRNVFTNQITDAFQGQSQGAFAGQDPATALTPETRADIPGPVLEKITSALSASISHTFLWALIPTVLALLTVMMMPGDRIVIPSRQNAPQKSPN